MMIVAETLEEAVDAFSRVAHAILDRDFRNDATLAARDGFYASRIISGKIVQRYEIEVVRLLLGVEPAESYHEVGAGIGVIPIVLALLGKRAVAIESYAPRANWTREIIATLDRTWPGLARRVEVMEAPAPEAFEKLETKNACCVTTNVGAARPEPDVRRYLLAVREHYKAYLFDLALLWGVFRQPEARAERLDYVRSVWNCEPRLISERKDYEFYYLCDFAKDRLAAA